MTDTKESSTQEKIEKKATEKMQAPEKTESPKPVKEVKVEAKKEDVKETKKDEAAPKKEAPVQKEQPKKPVAKKDVARVNAKSVPISTKYSVAICKFIKGKRINEAIRYLEEVIKKKKAIPMKGEIPHRKGKMMSGRFPKKASEEFIILLKSLVGNAQDIDDPVITEAIPNLAARPFGRFGKVKRKRTHITLVARAKKPKKEKKKK